MIRVRTLQPITTLGLGIICLSCLILLFVTGVTLLLYYIPSEDVAYDRYHSHHDHSAVWRAGAKPPLPGG